jgi:hypothetical protein
MSRLATHMFNGMTNGEMTKKIGMARFKFSEDFLIVLIICLVYLEHFWYMVMIETMII